MSGDVALQGEGELESLLRSNAGEVEEFDRDGSSAGDVDNDSRDTSRLASRRAMRVLPVCIRHEGE